MQINVSQLFKEPIGSTRQYEINETIDVSGGSHEIQGEVKLVRTDRGILVKGTLQTGIEVTCGRCLSFFNCPLTLNIEEEYFPTTDVVSGVLLPLPEEPSYFTIDEYYVLDLTEAIRQYMMLAIPMKPLCREDCAGICLTCGHNLNQGPCGCLPQEADSRWSELNRLTLTNDT
jgi:uncharacterized protein